MALISRGEALLTPAAVDAQIPAPTARRFWSNNSREGELVPALGSLF